MPGGGRSFPRHIQSEDIMKFTVDRADEFIRSHAIDEAFRPLYHLAPPIGWINDPNGFCWFKGRYHVFCQYYPYQPVWGPMHWGHWSSSDLVSWQWEGVAIAPDQPYDDLGCFSGTALERDGKLWLVYTGVHRDALGEVIQEQCLAVSEDGIRFEKYAGNPIIKADMLPWGSDRRDFRDPKLMDDERGLRIMVAHRGENSGHIVSFRGSDMYTWVYDGELADGISKMPECPDYFPLDGKDILLTCLMNQPMDGLKYQNEHHAVVYYAGREQSGRFQAEYLRSIDLGQDFYAPQTIMAPEGRRLLIGWMQMWGEAPPNFYLRHGWQGAYTFPRELSLEGNELIQKPVREIETLYTESKTVAQVRAEGVTELEGFGGQAYRVSMTLENMQGKEQVIRLMDDGRDAYVSLCYDKQSGVLSLDRSRMPWPVLALAERRGEGYEAHDIAAVQLEAGLERLDLDILVDTCSLEVFANGGRAVLSSLVYPEERENGLRLEGAFDAKDIRFHALK